jgi:hypothetical protein
VYRRDTHPAHRSGRQVASLLPIVVAQEPAWLPPAAGVAVSNGAMVVTPPALVGAGVAVLGPQPAAARVAITTTAIAASLVSNRLPIIANFLVAL